MKKYKGTPIIYDYWIDYETNFIFAIVEWTEEKTKGKKSNLILHSREYYDYPTKF